MKLVQAVALIALGTSGALVVSHTARTTPGITFSNVLTKAKDGRVITSTVVPKPTWRGNQTWLITIQRPAPFPVESLTLKGTGGMGKFAFVDSVWAPFPACVPYRVTVWPDTVLTSTGRVSAKRDSVTAKLSLCRPYTVAEAAWADSFPASGWRVTWCGGWQRRMTLAQLDTAQADRLRAARTAAESTAANREIASARLRPDSMPMIRRTTWGKDDTLRAEVGFIYRVAWLAKNRYTGRVMYLHADDDTLRTNRACEQERADYQASPEGRTP
jgi:hypothetical protein